MENPQYLLERIASILPEIKYMACDKDGSVWVFTQEPNTLIENRSHERYRDGEESYIGDVLLVSPIFAKNLKWHTDDWTKRIVSV